MIVFYLEYEMCIIGKHNKSRIVAKIPPEECECCVLSGSVLCGGLITRPLTTMVRCFVWSRNLKRPWSTLGRSAIGKKSLHLISIWIFVSTTCIFMIECTLRSYVNLLMIVSVIQSKAFVFKLKLYFRYPLLLHEHPCVKPYKFW